MVGLFVNDLEGNTSECVARGQGPIEERATLRDVVFIPCCLNVVDERNGSRLFANITSNHNVAG